MWKTREPIGRDWTFTFGKHKGEVLSDVLEDDPSYLQWCVENVDWFAERLEDGLEDEIEIAAEEDFDYGWENPDAWYKGS